jgi:glycosyltransferase involved in cell wall biosynthesis
MVIKNGCTNFPTFKPYKKGDPIKLIFHPTPWRGLNVMLAAMQLIKNPLITLDVYSSCEVYGSDFKKANDHQYQELYEQAKQLPNVNYIGYKPNEYILEHMQDYQIFAYPNIWEETFCISAVEAMAAGLHVVTTNHGALFETCAEWPVYVNYVSDYEKLAQSFAYAIEAAAAYLHENHIQDHLQEQQKFYKRFYNWDKKAHEWTSFLTGALNARRK